ncbi:MAG: methionine--tRNA ligase, partial [Pseudomonadota bacterium]
MTLRPLLVTSALPYANGPIHLGHLVENIQSDIFARFSRLVGREVLYVCAADTHGTPIEVNARKQGLDPAVMVERYREEHARDFAAFQVSFDIYSSTNTDENRRWAERIFAALKSGGHVLEKPLDQFYCEKDARFLPDRFVKGDCPFCGAKEQYGDVCESCNKTYSPTDLKEPWCVLCRTAPVRRESNHLFVRLADFAPMLATFAERLQPEVRNYVSRWLEEGLKDWCVSRDGPYFGFRIPETDKYFYVWLDAPVGYVSSAEACAKAKGLDVGRFWGGASDAQGEGEVVHFIGKDIVYFHTLFWPAMLSAAKLDLPTTIHVHGMLNLGGAKMSKSRGRMITAREWLDALDPAYLRYYLAANLGPALDDIEFSTEELRLRVNSQLVNNVGNLFQRSLSFLSTKLEGRLSTATPLDAETERKLDGWAAQAKAAFAERNYREAVRATESLAAWANEFIQNVAAPWKTIKTDVDRARADLTLVANLLKRLATMLQPVVPVLADAMFAQLGVKPATWDEGVAMNLKDHVIGTPSPLLTPLEEGALEKLFAPKESPVTTAPVAAAAPIEPVAPEIAFDDFTRLDLRVGLVLAAEALPKSDKMLKLSVDLGEGAPRTIGAGIAKAYAPEELVGRRVVVVANLAPRLMKIGKTEFVSQGMVL